MATPTRSSVADDVDIVRRILAHIDAGTTDEGDAWREPVENYLDPTRFADELEMLRSYPSVYLPSAALPKPGDHVERVASACRCSRCAAATAGHGCSATPAGTAAWPSSKGRAVRAALVCRYHGWTYRLDGSLSHVPHADAFPDLDMPTRGLVEVDSREVDGLIVIGPLRHRDRVRTMPRWRACPTAARGATS